jgi:membrane peptidoglycan carboxypeptidase
VPSSRRRVGIVRRLAARLLLFALCAYLVVAASVVSLRWVPPFTTAMQAQRRVEALLARKPYHKRYDFVPLNRITPDLQHAVIASEDSRFYQHHGFDWVEIQNAIDDQDEDRPLRGASTITQQLVKNLYLTTQRSFLRKAFEASLVPVAEFALGKQRILELYLNVVGSRSIWSRGGGRVPLWRARLTIKPRAVRATGGHTAQPAPAQAGPHECESRNHSRANAPDGMVI